MSHDDHIHQYPQHKNPFQLLEGHGSLPDTPQEQRRAVLWRRRMKLEFEMQGLFIHAPPLFMSGSVCMAAKKRWETRYPKLRATSFSLDL